MTGRPTMHIVLLTIDYSVRGSGGIGAYVETVASGLPRRGHRVTVVSPLLTGRTADTHHLVRLDADVARERRRPELAVAFRDAVLAIHDRHPVDVVEATDYGLEGNACVAEPALASAGITTVVRMHTPDSLVCELNGEVRLTDSPAVHACEGGYFRAARHVSSPSTAMVRELDARWGVDPARVTVIPNPVDTAALPPRRRHQRRARDAFRLTYFGRLERRKGTHVLAAALMAVLPRRRNLIVEFVGADTRTAAGSHGRHLREMLAPWSDRVRFTGFLRGDERLDALRRADAVCIPSLWENFPYACLEALAVGCPVIATAGSGFDEIVEPGVDGLLVTAGDVAALASGITAVVDGEFSPPPAAHLAERVAAFDVSRVLPRLETYYAAVAS